MICFRRGHNFKKVGAEDLISEVEQAELIRQEINNLIKKHNIKNIKDVTPKDIDNDLEYSVTLANNSNAEFYFSIHFNAHSRTNIERGVEVWCYNQQLPQAKRVCENIANLGFKNRGVKLSTKYYELKKTICKSMIIEVCFVDSVADVNLYKKVGYKSIAKAILEGVLGYKLTDTNVAEKMYNVYIAKNLTKDDANKKVSELESKGVKAFIE